MSEDVSASVRVGITIILVAALVATVLNLMVMSTSLLNSGRSTLQGGIDSISQQEFAAYDNTKVSGTEVATALSLFQNRDVAILVQTKAFAEIGVTSPGTPGPNANKALNYGALITKDGKASGTANMPDKMGDGGSLAVDTNIITSQAKMAYIVTFGDADGGGSISCYRQTGAPNYTACLHNTNGLVDSCYDVIGTTELGNAAYLLSSARFSSVLIKDPTGSIIGILFKQLQ